MPLTPEKIAALDAQYGNQQPDYLTELTTPKSGLTPEKIAALDAHFGNNKAIQAPNPVGIGRTIADQSLQGATFGFGDEVTDPLGATFAALKENPIGFAKSILTGKTPEVSPELSDEILNVRNASKERMQQEFQQNPGTAIGSNIVGALATSGAGAATKAGSIIANSLRTGNTAARLGKASLAGATSGGLYGAGTAEDGNRGEGAIIGATTGAALPVAIGTTGAITKDLLQTGKSAIQGALSKSPEIVQDIAGSMTSAAGDLYDKMRNAGATFKQSATQGFLLPDVDSALKKLNFIPGLSPKTNAIVDDLKQKIAGGDLGLDQLDQYRRQLGRTGGGEESVASGAVRKIIDDFVDNANASHLSSGNKNAVDLLNEGRKQYSQAAKFQNIADILKTADGDPNKIKAGLKRFLNNDSNTRGWTAGEVSELKNAASGSGIEQLLKMGGKFGIDLGSSLNVGNTIGPLVGYGISGGGAPIAGTAARQIQKWAARGKAQNLLNVLDGTTKISSSPTSLPPLNGTANRLMQMVSTPLIIQSNAARVNP